MMSAFGFSEAPFSKTKLAFFLLALAAVGGAALMPAVPQGAEPAAIKQSGGGTLGAVSELLRFGRPSDEILERLPEIGIPWFMRRAGVTGHFDVSEANELVVTLVWDGKTVGRYIERLHSIDEDRTRLSVAFEPTDMALVRRVAAPIDTALDPPSLMRVTMAEHVRASIEGDGFRLNVLEQGRQRSRLDAAVGALRSERSRDTDDFPLSGSEREDAAIRQAYRDEARRAGPAAPNL